MEAPSRFSLVSALIVAVAVAARWVGVPLAIVIMGLVVSGLVAINVVTMQWEATLRG